MCLDLIETSSYLANTACLIKNYILPVQLRDNIPKLMALVNRFKMIK